jgi:hypothetical protein
MIESAIHPLVGKCVMTPAAENEPSREVVIVSVASTRYGLKAIADDGSNWVPENLTLVKRNCYRVWMKDGYASLINAVTEDEAKAEAVRAATATCEGLAMSASEKRAATTVRRVENLSSR